jgi:HD superfamily phosphohydrolase YqeK
MIDIFYAKKQFDDFLNGFDRENEKVKLKIVHTYGVVDAAHEIAVRMNLDEEEILLAELIALLHDIGRFEQLRQYDSFEPTTMDHAAYGVQILFGEQRMIRKFIPEDRFDPIIRHAIARHSDYQLKMTGNQKMDLQAALLRDADKLDNCRVKLEESIEVLLGLDAKTAGKQKISDPIWQTCLERKSILSSDRVTKMDYWVSYIAYFFDINFAATARIIQEQAYIDHIIDRIPYDNEDTKKKMDVLREMTSEYMKNLCLRKA